MRKMLFILLGGIFFWGCTKTNDDNGNTNIDVSGQCYVDFAGNELNTTGICSGTNFNKNELDLFKNMDTVSLNNTAKPDTVKGIDIYPIPFKGSMNLPFSFNEFFNGKVVLKYVIVNDELNILQKNYVKNIMKGTRINISVNLPNGKYRLYMTLSAENHKNFYTLWRNIQIGDFPITP